jgi:putative FmdB family regulatory protein
MPTYDYACTSCGNTWELEQRIIEDPAKKCPKCGKNTAKRQISSGGAFILKGGGWYADGYGTKKSSSADSKSDDKSAKSDLKPESSSEAAAGKPGGKKDGESSSGGGSTKDSTSGSGTSDTGSKDKPPSPSKDKASAA